MKLTYKIVEGKRDRFSNWEIECTVVRISDGRIMGYLCSRKAAREFIARLEDSGSPLTVECDLMPVAEK